MEIWPLGLLIIGFIVASLILPWVQQGRLNTLRSEIAALRRELQKRETGRAEPPEQKPAAAPPETPVVQAEPHVPPLPPPASSPAKAARDAAPQPVVPRAAKPAQGPRGWAGLDLEQELGGRIAVWTGGVALALAGLFLVKYSIDMGLLTETVRVALGCAFGLVLLVIASRVRARSIANGVRIAQALSGAGIAVLYVSLYAATSLYDLLSPTLGFLALAAVTAVAVALSILHGQPIAVLGLVGGFLTPGFVETETPSASGLFVYLAALVAGIMAVMRGKTWPWLAWPTLLGAFLWVGLWLVGPFSPPDAIWVAFFLAVLSGSVVVAFQGEDAIAGARSWAGRAFLRNVALCLALAAMGLTVGRANFDLMSWGLFGLIAAAGIALAYAKPQHYRAVPWASAIVAMVLFGIWSSDEPQRLLSLLMTFAALHVGSGYFLLWPAARRRLGRRFVAFPRSASSLSLISGCDMPLFCRPCRLFGESRRSSWRQAPLLPCGK